MRKLPKILAWVEDPGALNFLDPVLEELKTLEILYLNMCDRARQDTPLSLENIDRILDDFCPRMILVGTSFNTRSIGLDLIQKARTREIMTVGYVDARVNAERRFSGTTGDPLRFAPDWLLVPDLWTKRSFENLGFNPSRIITCGHPHYDRVRNEYLKSQEINKRKFARQTFPGLKEKDQIVLFALEPFDDAVSDKNVTSQYTLKGTSGSGNRNKIALEEFMVAVENLDTRPYLVLRPHPRSKPLDLAPYFQFFNHISMKDEPPLQVIFTSDLIVGITSMFLLEATIMKRKVLSILPRKEERDLLPVLENNLVPNFTDRKPLIEGFQKILDEDFKLDESDLDRIFHFGATDRVCRVIVDLLDEKNPAQEDIL